MSDKKIDEETGVETTGHSWDGIEELNNPLPRWWLWTFYITIIWGIGYVIAFPAWPLINGATEGVLGWSTRANVAADISAHEAKNADIVADLLAADLDTLEANGDLHRYAVSRGNAVFKAQCVQCHGAGAAGSQGYPNLLDDDWLWGGTLTEISHSIRHGIRNETDDDAHYSEMPAFKGLLEHSEVNAVVEYVYSLSHDDVNQDLRTQGEDLYVDMCADCHGESGHGDQSIGAPNLADAIWLYGGDRETLAETVENSRYGVMPAWGQRLSEEDVRAVATYVHALGGGT